MKSNYKALSELIEKVDERNADGAITELIGVSIDKCFIKSVANTNGTDLSKYKIIRKNEFAVSLMQVSRDSKIPIARLEDYDVAIMSPAYPIFRVKDTSVVLPEYLEMWFKRPEFDREAAFIAVGGVRGSMPWEEFAKMKLPVPPMDKQKNIVKAYKTITDRIALKQKINDNLEAQALALFSDFVSQHNEKWAQGKLGDVISSANTGGDAIQKVPIVDYDTGIKCARVGDITNAREFASWAFCSATNSVFDNYKLQAGDILVTRTATLGITQYIPSDISAVYNNGLIRLKTDNNRALPLYVYWAINTSDFMNYINQMNSATSVRPNMKIDYLLNYQLLIPPIEKQIQFVKAVEVLMNAISLNNNERLKLCDFQSTLLNTLSRR